MFKDVAEIVTYLEKAGYQVMNWKPGRHRIFKILGSNGQEVSEGMYLAELRAWVSGYSEGVKK